MVTPPILEIKKLRREFPAGDDILVVLKDIDLRIMPGELVAIVGQSGSGKSTLMNILGCLDRPTAGEYFVGGKSVKDLNADELAELRREHFGFIFQRYHLLGDLTALGNVEVPAIYSGVSATSRKKRAKSLLERLGLGERMGHRPGQLSGGQQQRVSIGRALMNGGEIIFADEPTGALDTTSGEEVMRILKGLHKSGHTVVVVTHDKDLAEHCDRVIEIRDGEIIDDRKGQSLGDFDGTPLPQSDKKNNSGFFGWLDRLYEAFVMSLLAMKTHKLRTFLTMLGIIIGIASVVSVVALGEGAKQAQMKQLSSFGTNSLDIMPGSGFGDMRSSSVRTLSILDADVLSKQPYVDSVTPIVGTSKTVKFGNIAANASISGVGEQYFKAKALEIDKGELFDAQDVENNVQEAVIDKNTVDTMFKGYDGQIIGQTLILGATPVKVKGVLKKTASGFGNDSMEIYMPYTSVNSRILGTSTLQSISVRLKDDTDSKAAEAGVTNLLTKRHGTKDFFIMNSQEFLEKVKTFLSIASLLISSIAVISLLVGGIGVMNIMLVSVTERTSEIGVRMAVGARQADILQQFLIEAILVCLIGGALGISLALLIGFGFNKVSSDFKMIFSVTTIFAAFSVSTFIGVLFGFLPARSAARLDPVTALARD